jgi:hypothetical protein
MDLGLELVLRASPHRTLGKNHVSSCAKVARRSGCPYLHPSVASKQALPKLIFPDMYPSEMNSELCVGFRLQYRMVMNAIC